MKEKLYRLFSVIGEYALYGLLFFLPISNALIESFIGLALLGFLGRKIIKPDFGFFYKFWPNIFLLLFLFFSTLSLFNSGAYIKISLNALFGKWLKYAVVYIIFQDNIYTQKVVKRGIFIFLLSAILVVFSGLTQYFFNVEFLRHRALGYLSPSLHAATSCFSHYNAFGGYLVVALALITALLLSGDYGRIRAIGLAFTAVFSTLALIFTFSRGSWLAVASAVVIIFAVSRKNLKQLIILVIIALFIFIIFPLSYERLFSTFRSGGDSDRFRYWIAAFKMIKMHPFLGIGIGSFMANFSGFLPNCRISYAHNCYLQIWAETGIFSLLNFIIFIFSIIFLAVRKFFVSKDFLLLGILAGLSGFLVHSFFDVNMYSLRLAVLFWLWTGLAAAHISQKEG